MNNCIQFKGDGNIPCIDVNFPTFDDPYEFDVSEFREFIRRFFSQPQFRFPPDYMDVEQSEDFQLRAQQKFIPNYVNFHNNLSGCLLYHGLGSGKTCTSILVGEAFKAFHNNNINPNNRIIVVLPPSVEQQFIDELKDKCVSQILFNGENVSYKKEPTSRANKKQLEGLINRLKAKHSTGVTTSQIQRINSQNRRTVVDRETDFAILRIINMYWNIMTHIKFINNIVPRNTKVEEIGDVAVQLRRGGNLVIIDEVQNLISESGILYEKLIRTVNVFSRNNKFLLLSATPIYDKPFELGLTLNLLNPRVFFPLTRREFDSLFIDKKKQMTNKELFYWMCSGYVSYFSGGNPAHFPFKRVIECRYRMGSIQEEYYNAALINEMKIKKNKDGTTDIEDKGLKEDFMSKIRQYCNCTFPEDYTNSNGTLCKNDSNPKNYGEENLETIKLKYAPKLVGIAELIAQQPGIHFVFSDLKRYGITPLANILKRFFDFEQANQNTRFDTKKNRFAIWSGDIKSQDKAAFSKVIRGVVGDAKNRDGSYLRVVLGTTSIMEGVSFKNIKNVHIMNPWWNESRIQQVIARAIRFRSHDSLPERDQFVNVYRHICTFQDFPNSQYKSLETNYRGNDNMMNKLKLANIRGMLSSTVDQHMSLRSWEKKKESLQFETVLKESAVDCENNSFANYVRLDEMLIPSLDGDSHDLYYINPSNGRAYLKFVDDKLCDTISKEEYPNFIGRITSSRNTYFIEAEKVYEKGYRAESAYNPEGIVKTVFRYDTKPDGERLETRKGFIINENIDCRNNDGYVPHIKNDILERKINETISMKYFGRAMADVIFKKTQRVGDKQLRDTTIKTFYNDVIKNNEVLSNKFDKFYKNGSNETVIEKNNFIRQYFKLKYASEYNDEYMRLSIFNPEEVTDQYQQDLENTLLTKNIDIDEFKTNLEYLKTIYYIVYEYDIRTIDRLVKMYKE